MKIKLNECKCGRLIEPEYTICITCEPRIFRKGQRVGSIKYELGFYWVTVNSEVKRYKTYRGAAQFMDKNGYQEKGMN
jgi:hypothetical protein